MNRQSGVTEQPAQIHVLGFVCQQKQTSTQQSPLIYTELP